MGAGEQHGVDTEGGRSPALNPRTSLQVRLDLGGGVVPVLGVRTQEVPDESQRRPVLPFQGVEAVFEGADLPTHLPHLIFQPVELLRLPVRIGLPVGAAGSVPVSGELPPGDEDQCQ